MKWIGLKGRSALLLGVGVTVGLTLSRRKERPFEPAVDVTSHSSTDPEHRNHRDEAARGTSLVSIGTVVALFATLLVVGWQTHVFTRQAHIAQETAETSFNLAIMERLDRVLLEIADRPKVWSIVWAASGHCPDDNGEAQVLTHSLIDVLELALMAVDRLPGFAENGDDWKRYFDDVHRASGCVRHEIKSKPKYWPYSEEYLATRA